MPPNEPLYTGIADIFGASIPETAMRPTLGARRTRSKKSPTPLKSGGVAEYSPTQAGASPNSPAAAPGPRGGRAEYRKAIQVPRKLC